jgi:hypothetical protein
MRFSTYDLSSIYLIFALILTLTTQDVYDRGNESSKLISTIIFRRFLKLAITTSLYEGPFCSALPFEKDRTPVLSATPWITASTTVQNIVIIINSIIYYIAKSRYASL